MKYEINKDLPFIVQNENGDFICTTLKRGRGFNPDSLPGKEAVRNALRIARALNEMNKAVTKNEEK